MVDAGGMLLAPGLVNTHCHAGDSLFRGLVEDLPLEPWLQTVWKAEGAILTRDTVRLGATLGLAEMLLGGVTTTMDMFWHPLETVAAARALGVRVATGGIFFDGPGGRRAGAGGAAGRGRGVLRRLRRRRRRAARLLPARRLHGRAGEPASPPSGSPRRGAGSSARTPPRRRRSRPIVSGRYGRSVIRHLDALGLLDDRTVLAHCVWLDDEEIAILARSGATVSHNPVSNLKLASGIARVPDLLAAGVRVALGTDGAISGNDLDLWMALRLAATLHRGATRRADAVTTAQAFRMVTLDAAAALGAADRIGSLEPGKFADMILVDLARAHAVPLFDPLTHLVFSCAKSDVRARLRRRPAGGRGRAADRHRPRRAARRGGGADAADRRQRRAVTRLAAAPASAEGRESRR